MKDQALRAVREKLAAQLKRPEVPEVVWQYLLDDRLPQSVVEADCAVDRTDAFGDLARMARRLLKIHGNGPTRPLPPERRRPKAIPSRLSGDEMERMVTVSVCLARLAARHRDVRRFRSAVLGHERLTSAQARSLVGSLAAAVLSRAQFKKYGIPPVGHTATLVCHEGPWPIPLLPDSVQALEPGIVRGLDERGQERRLVTLFVDPPGATVPAVSAPEVEAVSLFVNDEGELIRAAVWPGSLLDELAHLAAALEERYHWPERTGAWFILTGQAPPVSPLTTAGRFTSHDDHIYGTITLTIQPWVSADTVLRTYRAIQRDTLGHDNRPLSARSLALLRFVMERSTDDGELPRWRTLVDEWNSAHSCEHTEWVYRGANGEPDIRRFARDFRRTYQAVVHPCYHCGT